MSSSIKPQKIRNTDLFELPHEQQGQVKLAQANKIQLYFSIWVLNESIAAIDKSCHQKHQITVQRKNKIIATILHETLIYSKFQNITFVTLDFNVVRGSHILIIEHHISADDALHLFTAYSEQCDHFICSDKHLTKQTKDKMGTLKIWSIDNQKEIRKLSKHLEL